MFGYWHHLPVNFGCMYSQEDLRAEVEVLDKNRENKHENSGLKNFPDFLKITLAIFLVVV